VFFALEGDAHDGHAYVEEVLGRGAIAAVVHQDCGTDPRLMRVRNTLAALQDAARWAREQWGGMVVGITGSAGKTSTKDVVSRLLSSSLKVGSTQGNFNNHIGLPLSILRIPDEARVAVLELGMNHEGEIRALAEIAKPQVAVVTNVGYAHIENFADGIEGVHRSKRELVESLPSSGTAVLNYDDARVREFRAAHTGTTVYYGFSPEADVRAQELVLREDGVHFRVGAAQFDSPLVGRHAVRNILAGVAVGRVFGIDDERLQEAVRSLVPGKMRGERIEHNGIKIINDCYNSNPDAVRSMLDVLRDIPARRHIAVLGEMLELGRWSEDLHREAGRYAARCGVSVLVGIRGVARALVEGAVEAGLRKDAAYFFGDPAEAGAWLRQVAQRGDAILFKGSRGTRVEKALETFLV
jgi:UDP-N-acetylmuramoyl-tripeptide--D-alanyl-D-alanine ligase